MKLHLFLKILPAMAVFGLCLVSCTQDVELTGTVPDISFNQVVFPIITQTCNASGCHGAEDTEEFTLLSYDDVIDHGEVKAKDARGSKLYKVITSPTGSVMPPSPNDPLPDSLIVKVYLWILQGAKNN